MALHISPDCKSYLAVSDALVKSQQVDPDWNPGLVNICERGMAVATSSKGDQNISKLD